MNWGHPERGKVLLLAGDAALAVATLSLAMLTKAGTNSYPWHQPGLLVVYASLFTAFFYIFDLYNVRGLNGIRTFTRLLAACTLATALLTLVIYALGWYAIRRGSLSIAVTSLLLSSAAWRAVYKRHCSGLFRNRAVLFIGDRDDAALLEEILRTECSPYDLRGFIETDESNQVPREREDWRPPHAAVAAAGNLLRHGNATAVIEQWALPEPANPWDSKPDGGQGLPVLSREQLMFTAAELGVDTIVLRRSSICPQLAEALTELRFRGVRIATMPDVCGEVLEGLPLDSLSDEWLSFAAGFPLLHQKIFRRAKRISDILFAGVGLVVSLPIALAAAIAIKVESPGPILFRQWRVGWNEKPFLLMKFRSMREDAESDGNPQWAAAKDPRVTRVGKILRTLHIDEIPQMINVLRGEMSFIGPRPERPEFVELLKMQIPFYSLRHYVPPGITGWAQVKYPYGATVQDARRKVEFDLYYVRNASLTLDLRILLRTVRVVIFRTGSR